MKIIFVGERSCGKSALINRLIYKNFVQTYPTVGVSHEIHQTTKKGGNEKFVIHIVEISGDENCDILIPEYLIDSKVVYCFYRDCPRFLELLKNIEEDRLILANTLLDSQSKYSVENTQNYFPGHQFFSVNSNDGKGIRKLYDVLKNFALEKPKIRSKNKKRCDIL